MERALVVLSFAAVLPACSWVEKLMGGDERGSSKQGDRMRRMHRPLTPTAPEKLASLLPRLEGWDGPPPHGAYVELDKRKFSRATATYTRKEGDLVRSAKLVITDGSNVANIDGPLVRMAHAGPNNPHTMGLNINGYSGLQEWQPEAGRVSAAMIVARRFSITLEGENLSPELVDTVLARIDMKTLASWASLK